MKGIFRTAGLFNQPLNSWNVSSVENMNRMFTGATLFDQEIGGWDVSSVTEMYYMFGDARSFNQDIGGWAVHNVKDMDTMFYEAKAFDQDLGWCVDDGVSLNYAFVNTPCYSTSCGVNWMSAGRCGNNVNWNMDNSIIRTAIAAWRSNPPAAEAIYGHISTWETGGVTDMSYLFCGDHYDPDCENSNADFNEDIGAWDTSGVTTMAYMFRDAWAFDRPIGGWDVRKVRSMNNMFSYPECRASSYKHPFNQDISGWSMREFTVKKANFEKLGSRAETSYASPLAHCRALIMYEYANNAPPGSRKAARAVHLLSS